MQRLLPIIALASLSVAGGCAISERARYRAAQAEYEACLERYPDDREACGELAGAAADAYDEYEDAGEYLCGLATDECEDH